MWYLIGGTLLLTLVWIYSKRDYLRMALKMIEVVRSISHEPLPAQHVAGNVYVVTYLHRGQEYKLFFPVRHDVKAQFKGKDVYVNIGGVTASLNQEPGVPYLIKANDFDQSAKICVCSEVDDTNITFEGLQSITM